ncbi:hypothetical protein [Streptomyces sp. Isolate_45]|uniref:hypothetical protein n=1 Tax=Streptomyces sp. Isolate_45 TaxID=2950111 RepID=UPI00248205AD|nr:hypothetical protein [Streptomyces sp. Isolate_45]MDA5283895.1 hypothetical protein [Streptomyces sp. Isolate_45]
MNTHRRRLGTGPTPDKREPSLTRDGGPPAQLAAERLGDVQAVTDPPARITGRRVLGTSPTTL